MNFPGKKHPFNEGNGFKLKLFKAWGFEPKRLKMSRPKDQTMITAPVHVTDPYQERFIIKT